MHSLIALAPMLGSLAAAAPFVARADNSGCTTLSVDSGAPVPGNGSTSAYLNATDLQAAAHNAPTPVGYLQAFSNEFGSEHNTEAYLTYFVLNSTYDPNACAALCNANSQCTAFNIYFARDPKFEIGTKCANPPPVTNIRCALFAADVAQARTTNENQYASANYEDTFERVHIGSNGYNRAPTPATPGFHFQNDLGAFAIEATSPDDSSNEYITLHIIPSSDPSPEVACADYCANTDIFNKRCVFFNTYVQLTDGVNDIGGTKCTLFSKVYGPERATNKGYEHAGAITTIEGSRSWSRDE
ncbi:hypothetical protein PMIN06_001010 [Paraphaeosphaeria minitans]